jgi:2,3-bisphosphoglycerate-independent phosphoglycerate mutase
VKHYELLRRLARPAETKIVLLVLDGVGDLRTAEQPQTPLARAATPNLDALAARSSLGRIVPVAPGITPGSGPGHLALFGYDPLDPEADIGRGVLEALGADTEVRGGDVVARGNYATADDGGRLTDRRAGRIPTAESERLTGVLREALAEDPPPGAEVVLRHGEGHRFVLLLRGEGLAAEVADTDPQREGVPPLQAEATDPRAETTARAVRHVVAVAERALAAEPRANRVLLRGFSSLPHLPSMTDLYGLRCGAFAGYPLYRGVAAACGMELVPCGKQPEETFAAAAGRWADFDYLFLHVKKADMAGEDGDFGAKVEAIEAVDRALPRLLEAGPDVLAITGDHSTPTPMRLHSWHPVPLLIAAATAYADRTTAFDEDQATAGHLGTFPSHHLMGLLLAHAGRLAKYGA